MIHSVLCLTILFLSIKLFSQKKQTTIDEKWQSPQSLSLLKSSPVALIPFPQKLNWTSNTWSLPSNISITYSVTEADSLENAIRSLQQVLQSEKLSFTIHPSPKKQTSPINTILLAIDHSLPTKQEGYTIQVTKSGIVITGKDAAGVFYGVQTLRQLVINEKGNKKIPGCTITDWPAFPLRGFMHDNGRNFQEIAFLKTQLDRLAAYKFNTFHWHLTDNPAWRPQSKIYPQLNEVKNRKPGRDEDRSYSFDEIRELIAYAKKLCIKVIPELDMPGHSAYFKTTFGFKMESEEGMQVLEKLIDEFCKEIPVEDCPIIHLGSDEVRIPNPKEFIQRMVTRVRSHQRRTMVWNPGLTAEKGTIEQLWRDEGVKNAERVSGNPYVDSYAGYLNSYDALSLIKRYFFQQVCNRPQGDSLALGGILCCWPDTRVADKKNILRYSPVWPGVITYSEAVWCGRPQYTGKYMSELPAVNTEAGKHFQEFENRLSKHRDRFFRNEPFPYVQFSNLKWKLSGPFTRTKDQSIDSDVLKEDQENKRIVTGAVLRFDALIDPTKRSDLANETVYISTNLFSAEAKTIHAWIGFETAVRSNRRSAGIPPAGKWDANGGTVWINDKELPAPLWNNPGANRYLTPTWETPANEIPYTDEEFYWTRKPAAIQLQKGWNKIMMRVPRTYKDQAWMSVFAPVKLNANNKWVEDLSLIFDPEKSK